VLSGGGGGGGGDLRWRWWSGVLSGGGGGGLRWRSDVEVEEEELEEEV
jgi:hypothetical protein